MSRIMCIQYVMLAGVLMPVVLIGSFSYIIPAFIYCKNFSYTEHQPKIGRVDNITLLKGITGTIVASDQLRLQEFKTDYSVNGSSLVFSPARPKYTCSNIYLEVPLEKGQNLTIQSDEISPLRVSVDGVALDSVEASFSHFSGYFNMSRVEARAVSVTTEAEVVIDGTRIAEYLSLDGPGNVTIRDSVACNQTVHAGGYYTYVQRDPGAALRQLHVTPKNSNIHGKAQKVCIPGPAFEGQCLIIQNKYLSGANAVRVYEDGALVEETNKWTAATGVYLKTFAYGEIIRLCYVYSGAAFPETPTVSMLNRGSIEVVIYNGELPGECAAA